MNEWTSKQWRDRNDTVIAEFRANGGRRESGPPLLLLTTTGRVSNKPHTTPLMYTTDAGRFIVIASKGGAAAHPAWYRNLAVNPEVTLEVNGETFVAKASTADPGERERLYAAQVAQYPFFAEYQEKTEREIPVVIFSRL